LITKSLEKIPVHFEEFETEQIYLKNEDKTLDGFAFVRRRGKKFLKNRSKWCKYIYIFCEKKYRI
jgi:hypothetical protein